MFAKKPVTTPARAKEAPAAADRPTASVTSAAPLTAGKRPTATTSLPKTTQSPPRQKDEIMNSKPSVTPTFRSDFRSDGPRADLPRREPSHNARGSENDGGRRLVVGREISLNGEISTCDCLVVEGKVEASVKEGRRIEIGETGLFKGTVEIEEADIAGQFEGDLTTRGRLTVRSTGIITGKVQYGELEIEAGGCINGTLNSIKAVQGDIKIQAQARPTAMKVAPASSAERLQADLASETA